jgi:outer membrane beta-barrel protein
MQKLIKHSLMITSLIFSVGAAAQDKQDSDKVDLKKLEERYWTAKDTDYSVVQNRTYAKDKRFFLNAGYGVLSNDSYSLGRMTNFSFGYYFNERMGMELSLENGSLNDNDAISRYRSQYGLSPDYNRFVKSKSLSFLWVPIYAKASLLEKSIVYFDVQLGVGLTLMDYEQQRDIGGELKSAVGFNFDITQQIFFHQHIALRLDVKNKFSKQDRVKYTPPSGGDRSISGTSQQDTTIILGITYFH